MDTLIIFCALLFFVAFLYASVGHGGASGYLALMALFSVTPAVMKPTALVLNILVSLVAFIQFYRGGHFHWNRFWPFAMLSVPMAFLGGMVPVDGSVYKKILGLLLLIPIARFYFFSNPQSSKQEPAVMPSVVIGGAIGFLSGLIGIGGGILLSPVPLLLKWADQKGAAAISALFILVNSASGLAGQLTQKITFNNDMAVYVAVAFAGGCCGAYFGALQFRQAILKNVLATVLALAAYKLLLTNV